MPTKIKRTYNLREETVSQVREMVSQYGSATSQDAVVELAVDRLYREVVDREEAARWADAGEDPEFRAEMGAIATAYRDTESWPR